MWISVKELAEKRGVSEQAIRKMISQGRYPARKNKETGGGRYKWEVWLPEINYRDNKLAPRIEQPEVAQPKVAQLEKKEVNKTLHSEEKIAEAKINSIVNKSEGGEMGSVEETINGRMREDDKDYDGDVAAPGEENFLGFSDAAFRSYVRDLDGREQMIEYYLSLGKGERSEFVKHVTRFVARGTFFRWLKKYREKGTIAAKERSDKGKKRKELPEEVGEIVKAFLISNPQWSVSEALRKTQLIAERGNIIDENGEVIEEISEYLVRRWVASRPIHDMWFNRWYSKSNRGLYASVMHSRGINPPNTIWMVDDHDQDVLVWAKDKDGKLRQVRPKAIRVIDPETNMIMGSKLTDEHYGAREIKEAILDGIIKHRMIPEQIYLECDKRMREKGIQQGLNFMGVRIIGTPYNPTAKSNVERSFGNDRMELDCQFDSYINNNVVNRPDDAENRVRVDYDEYAQAYLEYVERWNNERLSIYRGKKKMTPVAMWNQWIEKGWKPTRISGDVIRHLPYWFGKVEERVVNGGMVRFTIDGEQFFYIGDCLLGLPNGFPVEIRRNFMDMQTGYVYCEGKRIGTCEIVEKLGYGFDEYSNQKVVEMIAKYRNKRAKLLKVSADEMPFIESWIAIAEKYQKEKHGGEKMLIPTAVVKFLHEQTGSALEAVEKAQKREIKELELDKGIRAEGATDEEIRKMIAELG